MKIWKKNYVNVVFGTLLFGLFPMIAFGAIISTPAGPESTEYLDTNTVSVAWDNTSYIEVEDPNGNRCYINDPGYNGFNTASVGQGSTVSGYIPLHATCDITFDDATYWETDGTWTWNMWDDDIRTTLVDTGEFCQGTGCTSPAPTSTVATTTELQAIHEDLLWILWWIVFACSFLFFTRYYKT